MKLDPQAVAVLTGLVIPVLVGLVTKLSAPAKVKAIASIVLSAVAALIGQALAVDGSAVLTQRLVITWATTLGTAIASYLGVWKPVAQVNERLLPDKGISG
jgi:hypothetical protein